MSIVYLDPRKKGKYSFGNYSFPHEPFYIGKGKGNRAFNIFGHCHGFCKTKIKELKSLKLKPIIIILKSNYSEKSAHIVEKKLIKLIGRQDLKTGILCNHTDGGEGFSGYICTSETKRKISESWTNERKKQAGITFEKRIKKYWEEEFYKYDSIFKKYRKNNKNLNEYEIYKLVNKEIRMPPYYPNVRFVKKYPVLNSIFCRMYGNDYAEYERELKFKHIRGFNGKN